MVSHAFPHPGRADERAPTASPKRGTAWRTLPIEGPLEVVYEDVRGAWSSRVLDARELKLGPGRTLLGGTDRRHGLYRGLRTDRIRRLTDVETGLRVETGVLDWLLDRAEAQRRARTARERTGQAAARKTAARAPRRVGIAA